MLVYVRTLFNIALRRLGPEDLPASSFLLGLTLVGYLVAQVPITWITYGPTNAVATTIAVSAAMLIGFLWVLLRLTGYPNRFRQALTALLGTSALLSLLLIPFSLWSQAMLDSERDNTLPGIGILGIIIWSLVIDGHILSRALSRPFVIGLLVAIAYFLLHSTILFELLPDTLPRTER